MLNRVAVSFTGNSSPLEEALLRKHIDCILWVGRASIPTEYQREGARQYALSLTLMREFVNRKIVNTSYKDTVHKSTVLYVKNVRTPEFPAMKQ
jgi:predicted HTH transcriptional regulator